MNQADLNTGALVGLEDTAQSSGTATAPSTSTDILSSPQSLHAGRYELEVTVAMTGTAETLTRNLSLRLGTSVLFANLLTVPGVNTIKLRTTITNAMLTAAGAVGATLSAALQARTTATPTSGAIYTVAVRSTLIGG